MPREFSDGVYALGDALMEVGELIHDDDAHRNNEHRSSLLLAARITALIDRGGDFRAGAIAAIANWLVPDSIDSSEPPAAGWSLSSPIPLSTAAAGTNRIISRCSSRSRATP